MNTKAATVKKGKQGKNEKVHIIAPGERKIPSEWLRQNDFDVTAFPWLFSNGRYGLFYDKMEYHPSGSDNESDSDSESSDEKFQRSKSLTPSKYFASKVLNKNPQFAKDPDFVFVAQQYVERFDLERKIEVAMRKGKLNAKNEVTNEGNYFDMFKDIPGTPAYWKKMKNELFARMEQLGHFHLFFTLSCAEMKWPEIFAEIFRTLKCDVIYPEDWDGSEATITVNGERLDHFKEKYFKQNSLNTTTFLKDHFVLITRMFDDRVKNFMKNVLKQKGIENYAYRIEFQMRGLPHVHGVAWFDPKLYGYYMNENGSLRDDETGEVLTTLVDEWMSCKKETEDAELNEYIKYNEHKCSRSCKKKGGIECRFKFPKLPSERTIIASDQNLSGLSEETLEEYKDILKRVKQKLMELDQHKKTSVEQKQSKETDDPNLSDFLKQFEPPIDIKKYHEALKFSDIGKVIILKRRVSERNINSYNPFIQKLWRANTDIQLCLDPYAVITYVTDYMTKSDKGMTKFLKEALKAYQGESKFDILNHLKRTFFHHREMCVSEATYKLIPGMNLKDSNISSLFVQSRFPEHRQTLWRPVQDVDDETTNDEDQGIKIKGRKGKFKRASSNLHQMYEDRPEQELFKKMCFADFITMYDKCQPPKKVKKELQGNNFVSVKTSDDKFVIGFDGQKDMKLPLDIKLKDGSFMKLRTNRKILKIFKPKDPLEYIYSEMLLFLPWRDEINFFHNEEEDFQQHIQEKYNAEFQNIQTNRKAILPFANAVESMRELLEKEETRPAHIYDNINVLNEQENEDLSEQLKPPDLSTIFPEEEGTSEKSVGKSEKARPDPPCVEETHVMKEQVRNLTYEQRIAFDKFVHYVKTIICSENGGDIIPEPPLLIVTGKHSNW